jgi:NADPH:quinone reductase-like Zn-dependent oxidoreductase
VVEFGGLEVLVVGEVPVAGAGEVLIDVAVADVLFVDTIVWRRALSAQAPACWLEPSGEWRHWSNGRSSRH